jgi:hypothetical protein
VSEIGVIPNATMDVQTALEIIFPISTPEIVLPNRRGCSRALSGIMYVSLARSPIVRNVIIGRGDLVVTKKNMLVHFGSPQLCKLDCTFLGLAFVMPLKSDCEGP